MPGEDRQKDEPAPRVPAYPDGRGGLRMWCSWCDRWHCHSAGYGHRSAHCHNGNSPYQDTGYVLTDPAKITATAAAPPGR